MNYLAQLNHFRRTEIGVDPLWRLPEGREQVTFWPQDEERRAQAYSSRALAQEGWLPWVAPPVLVLPF